MTFPERLNLRDLLNLTAALVLVGLQSIGIGSAPSYAQDMMRGDSGMSRGGRMDDGGGMRRGGGAIGTGIDIGIGIGQALTQHPPVATQPEVREPTRRAKRSKKEEVSKNKPSRSDSETKSTAKAPELKFVGKPDTVLHNPLQKDGKLGDLNDHKRAVVSKDGTLFERHYYFTREGEQRTWFYYDVPITRNDPVIKQFKEVRNCGENDDNCDGPPPVYVDDKPAPGEIIEDKVDCPGGVVRVNLATSTCFNGKVQLHEDHYNYCPPDKTNYHHTHKDIPTETVCGEGAVAWTPGLDDLKGKGCGTAVDTGDTIMHPEDIGGIWVITVYKVYTCTGIPGQRFVGDPEKFSDGKVADGPPKPNLDPAKLAPPGPI